MRLLTTIIILIALTPFLPAETLTGENFSNGAPVPLASEYVGCNFSHRQPEIVAGKWRSRLINLATTATFRGCNFTNARPPVGSVEFGSNRTVKRFEVRGTTRTLSMLNVDGTTVTLAFIRRENRILGHRRPNSNFVDFKPSPTIIDADLPGNTPVLYRRGAIKVWIDRDRTEALRSEAAVRKARRKSNMIMEASK